MSPKSSPAILTSPIPRVDVKRSGISLGQTLRLWVVVRGAHRHRHPAPSTQLPSRPLGAVGAQHPRQAETKGGRYWGTKSQLPSALKTAQKQKKAL